MLGLHAWCWMQRTTRFPQNYNHRSFKCIYDILEGVLDDTNKTLKY